MSSPSSGGGKVLMGVAAALFSLMAPLLPLVLPILVVSAMTYDANQLRQASDSVYGHWSGSSGGYGTPGAVSKLMGALAWRTQAIAVGKAVDVDPNLILAIMAVESGGDMGDSSSAGAIGLMQLMPGTAAGLGVNPYIAEDNIRGGALYIKNMLSDYGQNLDEALAAYNAGPGKVPKGSGIPAIPETMFYVPAVKNYYETLQKSALQAPVNPGKPGNYGPIWYEGYPSVTLDYPSGPCTPGLKPLMPATGWQKPASGGPSDPYSYRQSPVTGTWRCHYGADIAAHERSELRPAATGLVVATVHDPGYGNTLIIDHGNGVFTWYAHLDQINVHPGEVVGKDQIVGFTGNTGAWTTGAHLHFEVHVLEIENGRAVMRTRDPEDYIGQIQ